MTMDIISYSHIQSLQNVIKKQNLDALVVTSHVDQFYLTQFPFYEEETVLVVSLQKVYCITRELYVEPFSKYAPQIEVIGKDDGRLQVTISLIESLGLKKVGFDATKEKYLAGKAMAKAGFVEVEGIITKLRETKDDTELAYLRKSNQIAYCAYEHVKPLVKTGMSEAEVATLLEQYMKSQGASATSFPTIVGFGANASNPHHETSDRKLKEDEAVLMDFGCLYKGYCSDITRSWWHGKNEPVEYKKIWNLVDKARIDGIAKVKAGFPTKEVDATSRKVITDGGYGKFFTHGTGHGVGIEIHENPYNNQTSSAILQVGNIVTVEPGIYIPDQFGVRLEDTVAVTTKDADILTKK